MKKLLLPLMGVAIAVASYAGRNVTILTSDGESDTYYTSDIDSIKNEGTSISLFEKESKIATYSLSDITDVTFGDYVDDDDPSAFSPDTIVTITFKTSSATFAYKNKAGEAVTTKGVECYYSAYEVNGVNCVGAVVESKSKNIGYVITGGTTQRNGCVVIFSDHKCRVTVNKLKLKGINSPAINIQSSKRTFFEIGEGENILSDTGEYPKDADISMKGTLFSEGELIFFGNEGNALTVNGGVKHGIVSDDYVSVYSGDITVNTVSPIDTINGDGFKPRKKFLMRGGKVTINSEGDGIDCTKGYIRIIDGTLTVTAGGKGIKTSYSTVDAIKEGDKPNYDIDPYVLIDGGTISITSGVSTAEVKKAHGIKSNSSVTINGGNVTIMANYAPKSDGINADGYFYLNGGTVECTPSRNCYDPLLFKQTGGTFNCNK